MTKPPPQWILGLGVCAFLVYALNYLYFFVDDEAIPYVYAQNLLHGRGLSYSVLEGHVEGYSDFLHVWESTAILACVNALHLPKWSVFFIGKGISLVCVVALLIVTWKVLERLRVGPCGAAAAMAIVCFSGPLAVWSNSSLETVPFALGVMVLVWALVAWRDRAALASAVFLVLERADGPIYAGAIIAAFALCSDSVRRREMLRRIVAPLAVLLVAYHGWRYWYFGDLFPTPLEAKILYRFRRAVLVVKAPPVGYLMRFAATYGGVAASTFAAVLITGIWVGRTLRPLALAALALILYADAVGDWMFGFRFFVPVVPMIALVCGALITMVTLRHLRIGVAMAALCVSWTAVTGVRFVATYWRAEHIRPFLLHPTGDLHQFFHPYFALYETARSLIAPGDVIAYNQAGFLPFMLDATNIDDLGICTRFYAELPSTDVFFTEVGRYNPLTATRELHAGEAYLLYRNARYVIVRTDLLLKANRDTVPRELLGGYYRLVAPDPEQENAIYERTELPADRFTHDPRAFVENVAHVSYIRRAHVDGREIPHREYLRTFPFLRDDVGHLDVHGSTTIDVVFADADEHVFELTTQGVWFDRPVSMEMLLFDVAGRPVFRQHLEIEPRVPRSIRLELPPDTRASRFQLEIATRDRLSARGSIEDLRAQGQTPPLEKYIARAVRFPAVR